MTISIVKIVAHYIQTGEMSPEAMHTIVEGAGKEAIPEVELAAFLAAVNAREKLGEQLPYEVAAVYTNSMAQSGLMFNWDDLDIPVSARHTPGCCGDIQSGPVDAIVRACDIASINLTGPRLYWTLGTVERFSAIPGFNAFLTPDQIRAQMRSVGMVLTGQSAEIAPADKKLYGLRARTGTVQSTAHICASVMSKKIASGPRYISLTVTRGEAAIMSTLSEAEACAKLMVGIGQALGVTIVGNMYHAYGPISCALGTGALSMKRAIQVLRGETPEDETLVVLNSAAPILLAAGKAPDLQAAFDLARKVISNGAALERFRSLVNAQGGDHHVCDDLDGVFGKANFVLPVRAERAGIVRNDIRALGDLGHDLTGAFQGEDWYPNGGILLSQQGRIGASVDQGDCLCEIHARSEDVANSILPAVQTAFTISDEPYEAPDPFAPLPSV